MKRLIALAAVIVLIAVAVVAGYKAGIEHTVTADGWLDGDCFIVEVDGNYYAWFVDLNDLEGDIFHVGQG